MGSAAATYRRMALLGRFWVARLLTIICCSSLLCLGYVSLLTPYVMPHFYEDDLSLADRLKSTSMGDSQSYGRYADDFLRHQSFQRSTGEPAVKHMPGLPLILAITFGVSGSIDTFRAFQILFFFVSLYFFLVQLKDKVPALVPPATVLILTLHPLMAKHFTAIMSDLLFSSMLLWIAFTLAEPDPGPKHFLGAGILFGLAVYLRESAFAFMAAVALAYLVKGRHTYLGRVTIMGCAFLAVLSPWIVRNYTHTHEFIPLTTKSTSLFYQYSIPLTTELYSPLDDSYDYQKLRDLHSKNVPDSSPIKAGLTNYVTRPGEQLISAALKTIALFNKPGLLRRSLPTIATIGLLIVNIGLAILHVGVILFGVVLAFTRYARPFPYLPYLIAAQYLQALFFWSEPRYLMPFYPFLITIALTWYHDHWRSLTARLTP
jgi:hypothetical protein